MGISPHAVRSEPHPTVGFDNRDGVAHPIRVLIIAGRGLFREALRVLLRDEAIEIVGETAHGIQDIQFISESRPNVVLIDTAAPWADAIELIRMIRRTRPEAKPLLLCSTGDESIVFNALRAGAKGYVSNTASAYDLRKAIQGVHRGEAWVERKLMLRFLGGDALLDGRAEETQKAALTPREQEVLRLLTSGGTNKDIARALLISEKTVKTHLNSIFRKLNVTRRLQAVLYAVRQGLR